MIKKTLLLLLPLSLFAEGALPPPSALSTTKSFMMIEPKERAEDLKEAFAILRKEASLSKITINLTNGERLSNISHFSHMDQGTLFLIKYNTAQGTKSRIVGTEEILSIQEL